MNKYLSIWDVISVVLKIVSIIILIIVTVKIIYS